MARMNPNFRDWDGPAFKEGRDVPCHVCEATGVCEDGEQLDVDDFRDCLCDHCEGTGIEPWRQAGGRDTGAPKHHDPLTHVAKERGSVMRIKREFGTWRGRGIERRYADARNRAMRESAGFRAYRLAEIEVEVEAAIPAISRETAGFMNSLVRDGYKTDLARGIAGMLFGRAA